MKKHQPLFVLFCLCQLWVYAQEFSLSGKVIDANANPVPFANVVLLNTDQTIIKGTISQENGSFRLSDLDQAAYQLQIAYVGYQTYLSDAFSLLASEELPPIILYANAENLEEVVLTAKKPTVTRLADRLVFTVANSIVSNGSTWEILQRTPGVVNNRDNLMIRGQSATVFLNGTRMQLSAEEVKTVLENLGGDTIEAVEVIANPPAQFDAEGGPVLNIITRKKINAGYKGNVAAAATYAVFPKYNVGTSHYFQGERLNIFANYNYNQRKELNDIDSYINFIRDGRRAARWDIDFERITRLRSHNANLIMDYAVAENHQLSFSALGFLAPDKTFRNTTFTDVQGGPDLESFTIDTNSKLNTDEHNLAFDFKYEWTLTNGSLSANAHYTNYARDRTQQLRSLYRDTSTSVFDQVDFFTDAAQDIDIYTAQLDYNVALKNLEINAGVKTSAIASRAAIDFFDIADESSTLNMALSDDFKYDEEVWAGYVSLSSEWEKWSAKAGLRAEQTYSEGISLVLDTTQDLAYLEWFPSAYLQYTPTANHSFSFDYGRRLTRPRYQDLNPFSYFQTENNFSRGNPNLLPAFAHRFNLNYTFKSSYSFDVYYTDNGENIVTLPFQDNQNFIFRTDRQNAVDSKSYGLDFTHGRTLVKGWYAYLYTSLFHEEETFVAVESNDAIVTNEVEGVYLSLSNFFTFNTAKTFSGELSLAYFSQFISGSYKQKANTNLVIGLRHTLWNKRAVIQLTANDVLGEANALLYSRYLNQDNGYFAVPETQRIRIGFTYNFGNFELEDNNRSIDKTERDRLSEK